MLKKSELYRKAQYAVADSFAMPHDEKIAILRLLMEQEDIALFCEKQEAEKANATV